MFGVLKIYYGCINSYVVPTVQCGERSIKWCICPEGMGKPQKLPKSGHAIKILNILLLQASGIGIYMLQGDGKSSHILVTDIYK